MRKIKITSSSFLVPNNKAWLNLEEIYKIDFSDYGNWIKTLLESKPNEIVSVVLFLKDIIDDKNQSFSGLKKILSSLINVLQKRLKTSKEPTIIFLSEGILESAINVAKSQSLNVKILNWVLTEIELLAKKFPKAKNYMDIHLT